MPQELIATLEEAKSKAVEISQKLAEASATASQIEEVRAKYKPAALRGAVLFFVLASLAAISNMYEYSLASFLAVFSLTLDTSKKVRGYLAHPLLSALPPCSTVRYCWPSKVHVSLVSHLHTSLSCHARPPCCHFQSVHLLCLASKEHLGLLYHLCMFLATCLTVFSCDRSFFLLAGTQP